MLPRRPLPDEPRNLTTALKYARRGIRVFPCNTEKRPLLDDWLNAASPDEAQLTEWWKRNPSALIGLPTKHLDLLVVDCDRHNPDEDGVALFGGMIADNGALPAHPTIETPNRGQHHIFKQPTEKIGNKIVAPGIETRGFKLENDGGYIIAPGTMLPDGRGWKLAAGSPSFLKSLLAGNIPQSTDWLADTLRDKPKAEFKFNGADSHRAGRREAAYAEAALSNCAAELAAKGEPGRNILLNNCALKMGHMIASGWIGRATVEGRLIDACKTNGYVQSDGERAAWATIASGINDGFLQPHPPLVDRPFEPRAQPKGNGQGPPSRDNARDWSDPDWSILDDRRGVLPEFPLDALSDKLQKTIERTAKGAGVTPAHVAVPLIGVVSSLIGTARRVRATSSWLQCTTCWTVVVGFSGTGKTPGINVTKRALNFLERNSKTADDERRRKHETKQEIASATRKCWEKNVKDAIEARMPAPPMPAGADDPGKFIPTKLWVADGTVERLADLLNARPQGVLVLRDELSALFTNMSRYSNGQDNEFWLEAWNGDAFSQERMSRTLHVDHLLIGITGGMQPDKLAKSFEGDHDGMYARVLFAWPPEPAYSPLNDDADEIDTDILNIVSRVNKLAEFTAEGALTTPKVPLSGEAGDEFAQFRQFAHRRKEEFEGREREWWAKMTAHVLRLAGTVTFLEWALSGEATKPVQIAKAQMQSATKMVRDYFWPHARACLRQIGLTERYANARRVLRWLAANRKTEVSREDIRRDALGQKLDAEQTADLLATLCNFGWMREEVTPPGPQGGKPVRRWLVNPKLFSNPTVETAETYP